MSAYNSHHCMYTCTSIRIVTLAYEVDISHDTLLRSCAHHLKTSGYVSYMCVCSKT